MSSYPDLDLTLSTRDGEVITVTTASYTREGVAEMAIEEMDQSISATIITAKQARQLADAFHKLATYWGE
jgi:ribosomal protein S3AE